MQDLNDLQYFAQVVRHGGFTAAARATGEPKAKLSKRVARLEKQFGARLIERSTRSFRVTEVGREVYRQCEVIEGGVEAAEAIAARAQTEVCGTVRAACPPGLLQLVGSQVLVGFMARYPAVRVHLHFSNRRVDLISEIFDLAFRVRSELDSDQSLTMRSLGRSRQILVASPALLAAGAPARLEDLALLPTLSMSEHLDRERWTLFNAAGEPRTVTHAPRLACMDITALRDAAVAGLGVSLIPEESCILEVRNGSLVQVLPEWNAPEGVIHLVFPTPKGMRPPVRAFIDHFVAAFAELDRPGSGPLTPS